MRKRKPLSKKTKRRISQTLSRRSLLVNGGIGGAVGAGSVVLRRKLLGQNLLNRQALREYGIETGIGAGGTILGNYLIDRFQK